MDGLEIPQLLKRDSLGKGFFVRFHLFLCCS